MTQNNQINQKSERLTIGSGSNTVFSDSSGIVLSGTARKLKELYISGFTFDNAPPIIRTNTVMSSLDYDNGNTGIFNFIIPRDVDITQSVNLYIHYYPSTNNVGSVIWNLIYLPIVNNVTLINGALTTVSATDTTSGTSFLATLSNGLTIPASSYAVGQLIMCSLRRQSISTFTGKSRVMGISIVYTCKNMGN